MQQQANVLTEGIDRRRRHLQHLQQDYTEMEAQLHQAQRSYADSMNQLEEMRQCVSTIQVRYYCSNLSMHWLALTVLPHTRLHPPLRPAVPQMISVICFMNDFGHAAGSG